MSVQAQSWVIKNSKHKGSALLVLLMIANHAHSDGTNAFPSFKLLAAECRMSERQIIRIVAFLEKSGEITVEKTKGRISNNYAVIMTANPDKLSQSNRDILSGSTMTNPKTNRDISGDSTMTFSTPNPDILPSPSYKDNNEPIEPIENRVEAHTETLQVFSQASVVVKDVFGFDLPIHTQQIIHAEIKDFGAWRTILIHAKAGMNESQLKSSTWINKSIQYALKDYAKQKASAPRTFYQNGKPVLEINDARNPLSGKFVY